MIAKIDFDTGESEPCKVCPVSVYVSRRWGKIDEMGKIDDKQSNGEIQKIDEHEWPAEEKHGDAVSDPAVSAISQLENGNA